MLLMDAKSGHLAPAARDVGQTGCAEAREEATDSAAEKVRCEVHQHVAVVCFAVGLNPGEYFAADGDALLNNQAALGGVDGFFDPPVPVRFAGFPAHGHAAAPVFVAWLEHQAVALAADEIEQLNRRAIVRRASVGDNACPRHMLANQFS